MRGFFFRLGNISLLGLGILLLVSVSPKSWRVFAQNPAQYQQIGSVSYQFNVLKHPTGLASSVDANNTFYLFIGDSGNNVIRQFQAPAGGGATLTTLAGNGTAGYVDGAISSAEFNHPTGLSGGLYSWLYFYVCGRSKCQIRYYYYYILVADASNFVVRRICLGNPPGGSTCASSPQSVTTVAGNHAQGYIDGPSLSAKFSALAGLSGSSTLYLADPQNNVIRSWDGSNVSTFAGNGSHGLVNAYRTSASFGAPIKMASDTNGNMYLTDADNFVIRKIDTTGNVTTFAGTGQNGFVDGPAAQAKFRHPTGIVFNAADGYIYVADTQNNAIRRIDAAGNVSTYAGTGVAGLTNGSLSQAQFFAPTDLLIFNGFMYVSDTNNNVIRRIDMTNQIVSTYIS